MRILLFLLSTTLSITAYGQYFPKSQYVNSMNYVRSGHTLTYLNSSYELSIAVGGYDQTKNLKSAEIYNRYDNTWTETDSMEFARYTHTANLLPNGNVIVIGGWDGGTINYLSTEIYDTVSHTWSMGPDMAVGRSGHTATTLQDGKILIVGGYTGTVNTNIVEIYDPAADSIYIVDTLTEGRSYHTATLMDNGKVLICGGYNPNFGYQMKSVEIYDPTTEKVTTGPDMLYARDYHSAVIFNDGSGKVMVTGGREFTGTGYIGIAKAEYYNPSNNQWVGMSDMPAGQSYHETFYIPLQDSITTVTFDAIVLIGGVDKSGSWGIDSSASYVYYIQDDIWHPINIKKSLNYERRSTTFDPCLGMCIGHIIITGGGDSTCELLTWGIIEGLKKQNPKSLFKISPNPASNYINIEYSDSKSYNFELINTLGEVVGKYNKSSSFGFDTQNYSRGLYTVLISTERGIHTEKIILE